VFKGSWLGNAVAVKTMDQGGLSKAARRALHSEVLAMCSLRHPCIAQPYGTVRGGGSRRCKWNCHCIVEVWL
jgi:hypothetical protein